jgi:hypothetical protein
MSYPSFITGEILTATDMNAVGMWLVKSQTVGTGVSSVTVTGAFSADYENYLIVANGIDASVGNVGLQMQVGSATTGYYWAGAYSSVLGAGASFFNGNAAGDTNVAVGYTGSQTDTSINTTVFSPFLAQVTKFSSPPSMGDSFVMWTGGAQTSATSHTSFTLTPAAGTLTGGTIRVYGIRN